MGRRRSRTDTTSCPFSGAPSRRTVMSGALGLTGLAAFQALGAGIGATIARAAGRRAVKGAHGKRLRGINIAVKAGRDREARFGLLFKQLPAYSPADNLLVQLAASMNDRKAPLNDVKDSDVAFDTATPAGYVYLGQFIDHDITLDRTPLTQQKQDVKGMVNFDSPQLDLGSVYGKGPVDSPELYDAAKPGYLRVNPHDGLVDLPRDEVGAAFLGDPRNDENLIVAQLHTVFLRLHNTFRDQGKTFEQAQKLTRWHYQWIVVNDFLPRMVGQDVVDSILVTTSTSISANPTYYLPKNRNKPYIPVEYAGAAYRFGHSMIRAEYEVQDGHTVPIFGRDNYEDLRGSRPIPANLWIDWNYFFDIPGLHTPDDRNMARKIDSQISLPLYTLPPTVVAPVAGAIVALAERNLLRGKRLGLPSGPDVARAMGITPLTATQLALPTAFKGAAPLWYYVLKEAELLAGGQRLGPVGGRIVAEVMLTLISLDKSSYFNRQPSFSPGSSFRMGDLILLAGALDPRSRIVPPADPEPQPPTPVTPAEKVNPEAVATVDAAVDETTDAAV